MMHHRLSKEHETKSIHLQVKVDMLRKSLEETQKYELLTTNQYLSQMELVVEILQAISVRADHTSARILFYTVFAEIYDSL
jgi:hypothetical protein